MPRSVALTALCAAAGALLCSCTGPSSGGSGAEVEADHVVVRFTDRSVEPAAARVAKGGNVRWVNGGDDIQGIVVFPEGIAASFTCRDLAPMFRRVEGTYRSLPISGAESERVALPCPLVPGRYAYEIWIVGAGFGIESGALLPEKKLGAQLVVE